MMSWPEKHDTERYLTHNEGKSVVAERFVRTLKNKIYKYMTSISKYVYIDKSDDIVNEYNDTYLNTIKMKTVDVKNDTHIDFMLEHQNTKTFFLKDIIQIGLRKFLLSVKLKIQFHGHILLMISMVKKLLDIFMKKYCKK